MLPSSSPVLAASFAEKSLCIVVAEDHDALREITVDVLRGAGHRAVGIACAEEMDEAIGGMPVDLLICICPERTA